MKKQLTFTVGEITLPRDRSEFAGASWTGNTSLQVAFLKPLEKRTSSIKNTATVRKHCYLIGSRNAKASSIPFYPHPHPVLNWTPSSTAASNAESLCRFPRFLCPKNKSSQLLVVSGQMNWNSKYFFPIQCIDNETLRPATKPTQVDKGDPNDRQRQREEITEKYAIKWIGYRKAIFPIKFKWCCNFKWEHFTIRNDHNFGSCLFSRSATTNQSF